jgi:hypothetical protein
MFFPYQGLLLVSGLLARVFPQSGAGICQLGAIIGGIGASIRSPMVYLSSL